MATSDLYFGASVVGPGHRANARPNEDSWLGVHGAFGSLVVVSDGMGSRSEARKGAMMACRAVLDAVQAWHKSGTCDIDALVAGIEPLWIKRVAPSKPRDCAATCLFALAHNRGSVHVAGVGDGLALVRNPEGLAWVVGPRATSFSNETDALGQMATWKTRTFPREDGTVVLLATDGVADDLIPENVGGFVEWLMTTFGPMAPRDRWRALQRELNNWPTPRHSDDKTIAVLAPRSGRPT